MFFSVASLSCRCLNAVIVGIHGAHDDELAHSRADASFVSRNFPRNAQRAFLGDWNVDLLPAMSNDPFKDLPSRQRHHLDRRLLLESWAGSETVECHVPDQCLSSPPCEACLFAPITRIPLGSQVGTPSLLDYAFATRYFIVESSIFWEGLPGDHALCAFICRPSFRTVRHPKRKWEPVSFDECCAHMSSIHVHDKMDASSMHANLIQKSVMIECLRPFEMFIVALLMRWILFRLHLCERKPGGFGRSEWLMLVFNHCCTK